MVGPKTKKSPLNFLLHTFLPNPKSKTCPELSRRISNPKSKIVSADKFLNLLEQNVLVNRLRNIVVTARFARLDLIADHGMRSHGDDGSMFQVGIGFDSPRRLPSVHDRHP